MDKASKLIIGISGEILSGKSTAAKFFVERFHFKQLQMSAILNEILNVLSLDQTRENQVNLINMLRVEFGPAVLANALLAVIEKSSHEVYLLDGIRKLEELQTFKENLHSFKLIFIKAPMEKRFERLKLRDEKIGERYDSWEDFEKSHHYETEVDIPLLENYADYVVENSATEQELNDKLTSIFTKIIL